MTHDEIRQRLITAVSTAAAAYATPIAVEYDNRKLVNYASVSEYLDVQVNIYDGYRADISNRPRHRIAGILSLAMYVKEGEGAANANKFLDHMYTRIQLGNHTDVRTYYARFAKPVTKSGWWGVAALIPFEADRIY